MLGTFFLLSNAGSRSQATTLVETAFARLLTFLADFLLTWLDPWAAIHVILCLRTRFPCREAGVSLGAAIRARVAGTKDVPRFTVDWAGDSADVSTDIFS